MQYKVIWEDTDAFEEAVNNAIEMGWRPVGGVGYHLSEWKDRKGYSESDSYFYQAMARKNPKPRRWWRFW